MDAIMASGGGSLVTLLTFKDTTFFIKKSDFVPKLKNSLLIFFKGKNTIDFNVIKILQHLVIASRIHMCAHIYNSIFA